MNREIKFRAWDDINKEMIYPHLTPSNFSSVSSWELLKNYENVMQYTGLKDKNGNEIYEGDIVKWDKHRPLLLFKWVDDGICFAGEAIDEVIKGEYHYLDTNDSAQIEIIGNIYQNPHLLTP